MGGLELASCVVRRPSVFLPSGLLSAPTVILPSQEGAAKDHDPRGAGNSSSRCGDGTGWGVPSRSEVWKRGLPHLVGWHRRWMLRGLLATFRGDILGTDGLERLSSGSDPFIVVMNHSTRLEALLLPVFFAFHRHGRVIPFVADWNFALIPGLGAALRAGDSILLVRKPAKPAFLNVFRPWFERKGPALEQAARLLRAGRSVGIFPEGTVNRHPTRLLRGFEGAARLSLLTGVSVLPVGVRFPGNPTGRPVRDRTRMQILAGEPLHPGASNAEPARDDVREWHGRIMLELGRLSGKIWDIGSSRRKHHGFE